MEQLSVTIRGDSMWPTLKDGDVVTCNSYQGETVLEGQIIVFTSPFDKKNIMIKRVKSIVENLLFVEGDNPDPSASNDSHNFGSINISTVIAVLD
jgi:nickel-type superoxide dismutase maturation protease